MTVKQYKEHVNKERKFNKNAWSFFQEMVNGKAIILKYFNTSIHVFKVNGINYPNPMDISVKEFNRIILSPFN